MMHFIVIWYALVPSQMGGTPLQFELERRGVVLSSHEACRTFAADYSLELKAKAGRDITFNCMHQPR